MTEKQKPTTAEEAEKLYWAARERMAKAMEGLRADVVEAKRDWDVFLEKESLAAQLNVPVEALEGEDVEVLRRLAAKRVTANPNNGVAKVEPVVASSKANG